MMAHNKSPMKAVPSYVCDLHTYAHTVVFLESLSPVWQLRVPDHSYGLMVQTEAFTEHLFDVRYCARCL